MRSDPYKTIIFAALLAFASAPVFALAAAAIYFSKFTDSSAFDGPDKWGVLGDFFGGTLGPTFNFLGMVLLVATILLQHQQIKDEKLATKEANDQVAAQHRAMIVQTFEQTFFSWLHSYRDIVASVRLGDSTGVEALTRIYGYAFSDSMIADAGQKLQLGSEQKMQSELYKLRDPSEAGSNASLTAQAYLGAYEKMYQTHISSLDTMFRTLYRLVKWVDQSQLTAIQKFDYVGIVRSQVSAIEMQYLFCNALNWRGCKFIPLLEKYAFFDNFEHADPIFRALRAVGGAEGQRLSDGAFDSEFAKQLL